MRTQISLNLDRVKIKNLLTSAKGPVSLKILELSRKTVLRAKQNVGRDSGALAKSIRILEKSRSMNGGLVVTSGSNLDYALTVHEGHGSYRIYPKNAKVLKFPGKRDGKILYRPYVDAKAQKGNPYLLSALEETIAKDL